MAASGETKPAAGVIATRPRDEPRRDAERGGFAAMLPLDESQPRRAAGMRRGARRREGGEAASQKPLVTPEPALKPNQPNQRDARAGEGHRELGSGRSCGYFKRFPDDERAHERGGAGPWMQ